MASRASRNARGHESARTMAPLLSFGTCRGDLLWKKRAYTNRPGMFIALKKLAYMGRYLLSVICHFPPFLPILAFLLRPNKEFYLLCSLKNSLWDGVGSPVDM